MLFGLEEPELQKFADRIAATVIVNQAVLKCLVRGMKVTPDNVILMVGDFVDPQDSGSAGVIGAILKAVDEVATVQAPCRDLNG
jgi:hypothetical protein